MKICITYNKELFHSIKRSLKPYNICIIPKPDYLLYNIVKKCKDKLHPLKRTSLVYKINCTSCEASYVGETKREVGIRIDEHVKNMTKDHEKHNVISQHRILGHIFDWCNVEILDYENHYYKRLLSEMIHINIQKYALNKKEDTKNLHSSYQKLINVLVKYNLIL